jgi:hypothetical protein
MDGYIRTSDDERPARSISFWGIAFSYTTIRKREKRKKKKKKSKTMLCFDWIYTLVRCAYKRYSLSPGCSFVSLFFRFFFLSFFLSFSLYLFLILFFKRKILVFAFFVSFLPTVVWIHCRSFVSVLFPPLLLLLLLPPSLTISLPYLIADALYTRNPP